jgi:HSP20 family molecular chaperone IbpA
MKMRQYLGMGTFVPFQPQTTFGPQGLGQAAGQYLLPTTFGLPTPGMVASLGHTGTTFPASYNPYVGLGYFGPATGLTLGTHLAGGNFGNIGTGTTFGNLPLGLQGGNQGLTGLTNGAIQQPLATELSENGNEYIVSFEVPGIEKEDLEVSLAGNTILVNGIRKNTQDVGALAYTEIARGNLTRAISVPFNIDANKAINTSLDNGVLKIRVAKETGSDIRTAARKIKIG